MFDEGYNTVTMNLPKKDKNIDEDINYDDETHNTKELSNDYEVENYEPLVREYSIDTWNGVRGMPKWGYKEGRV